MNLYFEEWHSNEMGQNLVDQRHYMEGKLEINLVPWTDGFLEAILEQNGVFELRYD